MFKKTALFLMDGFPNTNDHLAEDYETDDDSHSDGDDDDGDCDELDDVDGNFCAGDGDN